MVKVIITATVLITGYMAGQAEWNKFCKPQVCNHCWSYMIRTLNPRGDSHFMRCSILTANDNCCPEKYNSKYNSKLFTVTQPCSPEDPPGKLVEHKQTKISIANCLTSSEEEDLSVKTTIELFDENSAANVCSPSGDCLDSRVSTEVSDRNTTDLTGTCNITVVKHATCQEILVTKTKDDLYKVGSYVVVLIVGIIFGAGVYAFKVYRKKDQLGLQYQHARRTSNHPDSRNKSPDSVTKSPDSVAIDLER